MTTIAERVAAGAALLDERGPGWAGRIDPGRLAIHSRCRCVLGQLYPCEANPGLSYSEGRKRLRLSQPQAQALGFDTITTTGAPAENDKEYAELTAEWKRAIEARRQAVTA